AWIGTLGAIVGAFVVAACSPAAPATPADHAAATGRATAPHAVASDFAWTPLTIDSTIGAASNLDQVLVNGGEIVRFEAERPFSLREQLHTGPTFVEAITGASPKDGVVFARAAPTAFAFRFSTGSVTRAFAAHANDPGYFWFEHEARVLAWAEGPLGA